MNTLIDLTYIVSVICFVFGLKMLSSPARARRGNLLAAFGMLIAVVSTFFHEDITSYQWIIVGLVAGTIVGGISSQWVQMTQMPEMVALFNGSGGIASLLVGWQDYHTYLGLDPLTAGTIFFSVLTGGVSFTGSIIAWAKLKEIMSGRPILFPFQSWINALLLIGLIGGGVFYSIHSAQNYPLFMILIVGSLVLGVLAVIPIGGADMPVVISLLNSYTGLSACAVGFAVRNNILIVAGALIGASGFILTRLMCKAMNRSLSNVLFSGFGAVSQGEGGASKDQKAHPITPEDAFYILEAARSIVIVPGYGMAVAQAQHAVHELASLLEENGCEVVYAIHPVAGRMPGHMNVLLAEANIPYDQLVEMEAINRRMASVDVCLVIGANDVVNPSARTDKSSPIYGMPIIDADKAKTVFVFKRSMGSGFAGIPNPLFFNANTRMLFGDAKATITALITQFKSTS